MTATAPASSAILACVCEPLFVDEGKEVYLFSIDDVHDHAAFQHACQARLDGEVGLALGLAIAVAIRAVGRELGRHSACTLIVYHLRVLLCRGKDC